MDTKILPDNARVWRDARNLSAQQVADLMREDLGEDRRHLTSVTKMEKEGSQKSIAIRAYAKAVGVDFLDALEVFEATFARHALEKKSKTTGLILD